APEGIFDPGAGRKTPSIFAEGKARAGYLNSFEASCNVVFEVRLGAAGLHVEQRMVDRYAQTAGDRPGPGDTGAGLYRKYRETKDLGSNEGAESVSTVAPAVEIGPADIAFHAQHDRTQLPVESGRAAAMPAIEGIAGLKNALHERLSERSAIHPDAPG